MAGGRLGENIGLKEELILKACRLAIKAHDKYPGKHYLVEKIRGSTDAIIFAFPGSWSMEHWYSRKPFGETKIDLTNFPSMKSVGNNEVALVNEAFSRRFEHLLRNSPLESEVEKVISEGKQVLFAGHSSGGPIAILAGIWCLEKYIRPHMYKKPPFCVTFGSPLAGNRIFSHALRRENWACYFIHFVMQHDIVPRIMLAPLSSIEQNFQMIPEFIIPRFPHFQQELAGKSADASALFLSILKNSCSVASHAACNLKGCTNLLLETVSSFIELSPYRPFGTYILCTGNGKLVVIENPDAILQLLFYCLQLSPEFENPEFLHGIFKEHLAYEGELQESLNMENVVYLDNLVDIPLSCDANTKDAEATVNSALNDLGLTTRARLCLRAAGQWEKQRVENQKKINPKKHAIKEALNEIQEYKTKCEIRKVCYYDAFKVQKDTTDFNANLKRLELAGIWDEIMEMIKRYELPDVFEGQKEWIQLGTQFRRLVEPLDIANYYRRLKNEDTGPYMVKARPKRYRFTQRWYEHAEMLDTGSSCETTFWAEVEELKATPYGEAKDKISMLEAKLDLWTQRKLLGKYIYLDESTFSKWWSTLPPQHKINSRIAGYMSTSLNST